MRSLLSGPGPSILLGFAVAAVVATPLRAETLADAIALAYETNPQLQAQRAQLRAVNETYVQARAGAGVQVNAQAELAYQRLENTDNDAVLKGDSVGGNVGLTQPLFAGGRLAAAIDAAEADVLAARERLRQFESDLLARVIAAYAAVRRDQQTVMVARAAMEVLQKQLEETEAKVEVRESTRTDLAQAQARLASARSQVATFQAQLNQSRAQYLNVVGQNPGELAPEPDLPGLPPTVDAAFEAAEAANPTLVAAKRTEQASRARVSQARAAHFPSVNLRVQASRSPSQLHTPNPYYEAVTAQAVVTQPLFTSGLNASGVRRALELNNADRLSIEQTRRNVVQTVAQQWSQLAASRIAIQADQVGLAAAEEAFFGMRQEERFGLRSTIEVLNAQQELTQNQINLLRNRFNEYTARAGLLNAIGALTVATVAPNVPSYDAERDFDRVKNRFALPTEYVVRALDGVVTPPLGPPLAARETARPDEQLELPPTPTPEQMSAPLKSAADIMAETQRPVTTAPPDAAP